MGTLRFSLCSLFAAVAVVALGCMALANPSNTWMSITFSAAVALLFFAVLACLFGRFSARAFWGGFAVVGWGYLWAQGSLPFDVKNYNNEAQEYDPFITTRLLCLLAEAKGPGWPENADSPYTINDIDLYTRFRFTCIGQSLWAIVLGFIGGVVGHILYVKRQRAAGTATSP